MQQIQKKYKNTNTSKNTQTQIQIFGVNIYVTNLYGTNTKEIQKLKYKYTNKNTHILGKYL